MTTFGQSIVNMSAAIANVERERIRRKRFDIWDPPRRAPESRDCRRCGAPLPPHTHEMVAGFKFVVPAKCEYCGVPA